MTSRRFCADDWQLLNKEVAYDGYFQLVKYHFRHRLFAGGWSSPLVREVFERGHAAVALPYDPRTDEVVLIEQFRIGAEATSAQPWLIELAAGIIETDETPEGVARRETEEETGLVVGRCEKILSYLSSPGGCNERIYLFAAEVTAPQSEALCGLADEGEDIRVFTLPRVEAQRWVDEGRIDNAASIIGIQWLSLNHQRLREAWR